MPIDDCLHIYTDGSSLPSPRKGGIAIRYVCPSESGEDIIEDCEFPGFKGATNNQMELKACVVALENATDCTPLHRLARIIVYTDSMYVVNNYKKAMFEWPKTKWFSRSGAPVLNAELWKDLVSGIKNSPKRVEFKWVKGHSKSVHNKAVDKLAKQSANRPSKKRISIVDVRRKRSPNTVRVNSVKRVGQRLAIRIISSEYLSVQRMYKYKYEVASKQSQFYQNVDIVYSKEILRSGHTFLISFTEQDGNPFISKVIREIIET